MEEESIHDLDGHGLLELQQRWPWEEALGPLLLVVAAVREKELSTPFFVVEGS